MANAFYGLNFRMVSRGKGESAVKAGAYQSGERLTHKETGEIYDFTRHHNRKESTVLKNLMLLPEGADNRLLKRETFYNEIEQTHTAKNSQLGRWARVNIPREIPESQREKMVVDFVTSQFVDRGMCADIAFQTCPSADGKENPHFHLFLAMRPLTEDGRSFPKKAGVGRHWNNLFTKGVEHPEDGKEGFANTEGQGDGYVKNRNGLVNFRRLWAEHVNDWLEAGGSEKRCSHLSLKAQGIEREPIPHISKAIFGKDTKGQEQIKLVRKNNRLKSAQRFNQSGRAQTEAENIARATAASRAQTGRGKQWSLADDWGVDYER